MGISATQTREAAAKAIESHPAPKTRLSKNGHSEKDFKSLKKNLVAAATKVPTSLGGGNHGHAGILLDPLECLALTGDPLIAFNEEARPDDLPNIDPNDTPATVSLKQDTLAHAQATCHTQEGAKTAILESIISNADEETIIDLRDDDFGYTNVHPRDVLQHLQNGALSERIALMSRTR